MAAPTDTRSRLTAPERRERILAAATEVFAEHGYTGASVGEIARRAGVVASVIYDHFGSKRELHVALLQAHGEALIERSIAEVTGEAPHDLLRASIAAFFRFVEEDPFVWRFLFRDPPSDPEIAAAHRRVQERATAGIAALVAQAAPEVGSVLEVPAERATWMVAKASQAATQGLAEWWWEHPEVPREQVVELAVSLLWEGQCGLIERASSGRSGGGGDKDAASRAERHGPGDEGRSRGGGADRGRGGASARPGGR